MIEHHLKPRDSIHTASARTTGSAIIVSNDSDFDDIPGLKRLQPEEFLKALLTPPN